MSYFDHKLWMFDRAFPQPKETVMDLTNTTPITQVELDDGRDEYVRYEVPGTNAQELRTELEKRNCYDSTYPGGWFLNRVDVFQHEYREDEYIVVFQHRMDI